MIKGSDALTENGLPIVSVVIPCRNEALHIRSSVGSILNQDFSRESFEVIVADDRSDDGTRAILDELTKTEPRLRVIDNPRRFVSAGLNAAIRAARGKTIIRMDAHTEYAPDYVRECIRVLEETGADNVGGPWIARGVTYMGRAIAAVFQSPFGVGGARGHDCKYEGLVDTVYLGCWPRSIFERIGFFDEDLVRNQDDEFNLRLIRAGGRIWQSPRIKSSYRTRDSLLTLFRQYMQFGYWKVPVIKIHRSPASIRHLVPGGFLACLALSGGLAFVSPLAMWGLISLIGIYIACLVAASLMTAARTSVDLFPLLPFAFCCLHFGYGYGFLRGIWDFVICRNAPSAQFTELTRRPTALSGKSSVGLIRQ